MSGAGAATLAAYHDGHDRAAGRSGRSCPNIQDRDGAPDVLESIRRVLPWPPASRQNFEKTIATAEARILIAPIRLVTRRLARA